MPHKTKKSMGEFKRGTLTTKGRTVTSRNQAVAIGLAQDRKSHKGTKLAPPLPPGFKKKKKR